MKKLLLTFADSRMRAAADRLVRQATHIGVYDEVISFSEADLSRNFLERFQNRLVHGTRGFGYWCWKPQIILQILESMAEGDVLQYTDSGCHLNAGGVERLNEYFVMARDSECGLLVFQAKPPTHPLNYDGRPLLDLREFKWTKADLLQYFSFLSDDEILLSQQIGGGVVFVRKCSRAIEIVKEWLAVYERDFSLADDSPSRLENLPGFLEHRHDQSIISLLCKKHAAPTVSSYEYWYPLRGTLKPDWNALKRFPIHAKRDRGLSSFEKMRFFLVRVRRRLTRQAVKAPLPWMQPPSD